MRPLRERLEEALREAGPIYGTERLEALHDDAIHHMLRLAYARDSGSLTELDHAVTEAVRLVRGDEA